MAAPNEITPSQLLRRIGLPDAPVLIDVCIDADFALDPWLIPGSLRHPHTDIDTIRDRLAGRPGVVICQKGLKLSQGVAATLRAQGESCSYLQGGMQGWRQQTDALVRRTAGANVPAHTHLWVTRHRPKIDRIACPWLIRRFVDRDARFLFVAPTAVLDVAQRFDAIPFDVQGADIGHQDERCSFDALLDVFGLSSPALQAMAEVIRAADTGTLDQSPQAAGLLALSIGLSRQYRDDNQQLEAGLALYDALYRWARDGQSETHASFQGDAR